MKSTRLRIAARIIMFLGLASCLLGAGIYCVLCMPEVLNLPFDLSNILIVGCAAVISVIISIILHACAYYSELSVENYLSPDEVEDALASLSVDIQEEEALVLPELPSKDPDEEIEELEPLEPIAEEETEEKKAKKPTLPKGKAKLIAIAAIIAVPTVLAGVIAASTAKAKKKKKIEKERREKEANRQAFYRWLG